MSGECRIPFSDAKELKFPMRTRICDAETFLSWPKKKGIYPLPYADQVVSNTRAVRASASARSCRFYENAQKLLQNLASNNTIQYRYNPALPPWMACYILRLY